MTGLYGRGVRPNASSHDTGDADRLRVDSTNSSVSAGTRRDGQLRLAIVNLTSGGLSGGYSKYLSQVLPRLQLDTRVSALHVFNPPGLLDTDAAPIPTESWPVNDHLRGFRELKGILTRLRLDALFVPTARWINVKDLPTVVMLRNMEPFLENLKGNPPVEILKNRIRARRARFACVRASRTIAVSRHVHDHAVTAWNLERSKVAIVHHGVEEPVAASRAQIPKTLRQHARRFIFTAGSIRPARGLEDLIRALAMLTDKEIMLCVAGRADGGMSFYRRRLMSIAVEEGVADRIMWLGHLSKCEMAWCYLNCESFVTASRAEACPNTVLEAMSYGCLCIATEIDPMPEFLGDAALYFSPANPAHLASQLRRGTTLEDSDRLRQAAADRSNTFNWDLTTDRTIRVLESATL